jgi:ferrous iron transport protein B
MQAIYDVCSSINTKNDFKIEYENIIENAIDILEPNVKKLLSNQNFNNYRWICLKLLEGNKKILSSIENYLGIKLLESKNISSSLFEAKKLLLDNLYIRDHEAYTTQINL